MNEVERALKLIVEQREDIILPIDEMKRINQYILSQDFEGLKLLLTRCLLKKQEGMKNGGSSIIKLMSTEISRVHQLDKQEVMKNIDITINESMQIKDSEQLIELISNNIIQYLKKINLYKEDIGIVEQIRQYIEENYNKNIKVKELAEQYHINYTYLSTLFVKATGERLSSYLTKIRMEQAKKLLSESTFRIVKISEMVGYDDIQYFYRVFKKHTGYAPIKYRNITKKVQ
ncbi:MAG: helix-turn-helix transcriptional regulator [Anaerocolumna sp.]